MHKVCRRVANFSKKKENPFRNIVQTLQAGGKTHNYFSLPKLNDPRLGKYILTQTTSPSVFAFFSKVHSEIVISLKSSPPTLKISSTGKSRQKNKQKYLLNLQEQFSRILQESLLQWIQVKLYPFSCNERCHCIFWRKPKTDQSPLPSRFGY